MSRAAGRGRKPPRKGGITDPGPDSPEGRDIGESIRQDPDGWINTQTGNIVNRETTRQEVPVGDPPEQFGGWMAHGVPPEEDTTEERAAAERGPNEARKPARVAYDKPQPRPTPVPVYIVEQDSGSGPLSVASLLQLTAPAIGNNPNRLCGEDRRRSLIQVMNEDASNNVRVGALADLVVDTQNNVVHGGARLAAGATGYTAFRSQGELYVISETGTAASLSVILEFDAP